MLYLSLKKTGTHFVDFCGNDSIDLHFFYRGRVVSRPLTLVVRASIECEVFFSNKTSQDAIGWVRQELDCLQASIEKSMVFCPQISETFPMGRVFHTENSKKNIFPVDLQKFLLVSVL